MAEVIHHVDSDSHDGSRSTLTVVLAILLLAALLVGAWWIFRGQPANVAPDTRIQQNIEQNEQAPAVIPDTGTEQEGTETTPSP